MGSGPRGEVVAIVGHGKEVGSVAEGNGSSPFDMTAKGVEGSDCNVIGVDDEMGCEGGVGNDGKGAGIVGVGIVPLYEVVMVSG